MSRFADASDVKVVPIGACRCPGTPHAQDEATIHRQLGHGAKGEIQRAGWMSGRGIYFDSMAAQRMLVEVAVVSWNLLDADGKPARLSGDTIADLDDETILALSDAANEALEEKPLPNESGAPSADSSQASASPTPESQTPPTSTTT